MSVSMAQIEHVGFATIPAVPKCSIQLLLTDYNVLSLADDNDVPIQLDVLADIPAWVVAAHAEDEPVDR